MNLYVLLSHLLLCYILINVLLNCDVRRSGIVKYSTVPHLFMVEVYNVLFIHYFHLSALDHDYYFKSRDVGNESFYTYSNLIFFKRYFYLLILQNIEIVLSLKEWSVFFFFVNNSSLITVYLNKNYTESSGENSVSLCLSMWHIWDWHTLKSGNFICLVNRFISKKGDEKKEIPDK